MRFKTYFLLLFTFSISKWTYGAAPSLVIGIDADMSAVAVDGGVAIRRGVELAVEEINAQGGVLNRPLRIVAKDHRGNPARGVYNLKQYSEMPDLLAVVGGVHTPVILSEIDTIHEENLLMLVPWAAGTPIVDNGHSPNNVFRVSVRDSEAAIVLVNYAKQRSLKRVALVLERTGWGRSNLKSLSAAVDTQGLTISSVHWINWQQEDFSKDIKAIKDEGVDAIILVTNVPEGAVVLNAMAEHGMNTTPVISHWGIASGAFVSRLNNPIEDFDIAVLQTFHFDQQKNDRAKKLLAAYKAKYGVDNTLSIKAVTGLAHAYDLTHLVARAANEAGTTDVDMLREKLEAMAPFDGAVKHYSPPFTKERHDALWSNDYFMTKFNNKGQLVTTDDR
mgnify:CR=1 FL=1